MKRGAEDQRFGLCGPGIELTFDEPRARGWVPPGVPRNLLVFLSLTCAALAWLIPGAFWSGLCWNVAGALALNEAWHRQMARRTRAEHVTVTLVGEHGLRARVPIHLNVLPTVIAAVNNPEVRLYRSGQRGWGQKLTDLALHERNARER